MALHNLPVLKYDILKQRDTFYTKTNSFLLIVLFIFYAASSILILKSNIFVQQNLLETFGLWAAHWLVNGTATTSLTDLDHSLVKFKWILQHHLSLSVSLSHFPHLMKLCCRKKQSSLECHCDHSRQRQGQRRRSERRLAGPLLPNERPIILLTLSARLNLLIVPYVTVPLLISLVLCCLCCLLSAASNRAPSQPVASLNWNCNEFCASLLLKCTFLRRSLPLLLCALLFTSSSTRRRRQQLGSVSKLPCHALLMATLTATFLLLTVALNVRPVSAQSLALLGTDSADSYEHEDDEDSEQTGKLPLPVND